MSSIIQSFLYFLKRERERERLQQLIDLIDRAKNQSRGEKEMESSNPTEGRPTMSGFEDSNAPLATTHKAEISARGLHCALDIVEEESGDIPKSNGADLDVIVKFQSQGFDGLRPVSSTDNRADIKQCEVLDGDQDNARLIGTEFVVTEKIFGMLSEEEKLLWHSHKVELDHGSLSSPGTQEAANTYGRLVRPLESNSENALPPALSELLTSSSDPGLEKRHVTFVADEVKPHNSTRGSEEKTRPAEEQAGSGDDIAPRHREFGNDNKDDYLNDAVHRPMVHRRPSHMPAMTGRLPGNGRFLAETRSTGF